MTKATLQPPCFTWTHAIEPSTRLDALNADRVEMTGLPPSFLPHHRTCGFPEQDGQHAPSCHSLFRFAVRHVRQLRNVFRKVRAERPFTIDAIVILPDHLHAVWTLPDGDAGYSGRWRAIKSNFTHELRLSGMPLTPDKCGEYRLWQRFSLETEKTLLLYFVDATLGRKP